MIWISVLNRKLTGDVCENVFYWVLYINIYIYTQIILTYIYIYVYIIFLCKGHDLYFTLKVKDVVKQPDTYVQVAGLGFKSFSKRYNS